MSEGHEPRGVLGPLEAQVMDIVWSGGNDDGDGVSVRHVLGVLNDGRAEPLAYTTVMTTMARLAEKGVLDREHQGRGYVYRAAVSDRAAIAVRNVVRDFGDTAVAHFVDEARADPDLLRRLTKLLERDT